MRTTPPRVLRVSLLAAVLLAAGAARAEPDRTLTAQGEGRVEIAPDAARLYLGVEAEEPTLAEARRANERIFRKVLTQVQQLKINGLLMKSDGISVSLIKEDSPPRNKLAKVIGYRVYNSVTVRVTDSNAGNLAQHASRVLDAALAAGANHFNGVTFLRQDSRGAYNQALRQAIDDAKLNAAMIASQAKVNLGRLRSITPSWGSYYPELSYQPGGGWGGHRYGGHGWTQAASVSGHGSGTTVAAGAFQVRASVSAVFEIR